MREDFVLGAYARLGVRIPGAIEDELAGVYAMFPRLAERRAQNAGSLLGGEAQMVAVGRALMAKPQAAAVRRTVAGPGAATGA